MGPAASGAPGPTSIRPVTDRLLTWLPGPRVVLVCLWAVIPWLNLAAVLIAERAGAVPDVDDSSEIVNRAAVSFAIVLSLWGSARISDDLSRLRPALTERVEEDLPDVERLFRGLDSVAVPVVLTLAVGLVLPLDEALAGEPLAAVMQAATWLLIGIPLATAVWAYVTLQLGLHRLGRGRLTLRDYRGDRTLGMEPVGSLAFTGFWMLLGSLVPLALTGSSDLPSVLVTTAVLVAGIGLFFVSLLGLHRQMAAIKHRELARGRRLYEQAYVPFAEDPTLRSLDQQASLLNAAESLEKRAERIQAWPFDEATFARAVTIATSAVATIVARILLAPTGL